MIDSSDTELGPIVSQTRGNVIVQTDAGRISLPRASLTSTDQGLKVDALSVDLKALITTQASANPQ